MFNVPPMSPSRLEIHENKSLFVDYKIKGDLTVSHSGSIFKFMFLCESNDSKINEIKAQHLFH
jgi:hypothetical protein